MYYPYPTADSASSASTDVDEDKGNVAQYAKNILSVNNDIVQVLQTRPSGTRQVLLPAAERNVDVDVDVD